MCDRNPQPSIYLVEYVHRMLAEGVALKKVVEEGSEQYMTMLSVGQDMCAQPLGSIVLLCVQEQQIFKIAIPQDTAKCRRVRYTTVLLSRGTKQEGKIYLSLMKTHYPFCKS